MISRWEGALSAASREASSHPLALCGSCFDEVMEPKKMPASHSSKSCAPPISSRYPQFTEEYQFHRDGSSLSQAFSSPQPESS